MLQTELPSPAILELSWGRLKIDGQRQIFKDAKLFPGGASSWDWRKTGTRHEPGVQPADILELLAHDVAVVVIGIGFESRLRVQPETLALLETRGIAAHLKQSETAAHLYNELRCQMAVAALIHSTC